jgi:RHS repeat-associated protein
VNYYAEQPGSGGGDPNGQDDNPPPPIVLFNKNINYAYNYAGARTGIGTNLLPATANNTTNVAKEMAYRAFGSLRWARLNGEASSNNNHYLLSKSFNVRRQLAGLGVYLGSGSPMVLSQTYNYYTNGLNNGRLHQLTDGVDPNYSATYSYDSFNRVTNVTAMAYARTYTYDAWGNLRTVAGASGPSPSYAITYATNASGAPATNRINNVGTQGYGYDQAGNLTSDVANFYDYDAAKRLKSVGNNTYGYDGDGLRARQTISGGTPLFYVRSSVLKQVAMEVSSQSIYRAYVWQDGQALALQSYDGQFYWVFRDHLGNARKLGRTDGTIAYRAEYDPHGQILLETGTPDLNPHKFGGYERDATGLDYTPARTLLPNRGRFLQADPYGTAYRGGSPTPLGAASLRFPQSHNRYGYAWNDGVNLSDPSGLSIDPCCACPGHGEGCEGREPICPGGGGGQNCNEPTFQLCCTNQAGLCQVARDTCENRAWIAFAGAIGLCVTLCIRKGWESKECADCWAAPAAAIGVGLRAIAL